MCCAGAFFILGAEELEQYNENQKRPSIESLIVNDKNDLSLTIKPPADAHGFCKEFVASQPKSSAANEQK